MDYFYGIINPHFREAYLAVQESLTEYMQEYEDKKIGEWKVKTEEEIKKFINWAKSEIHSLATGAINAENYVVAKRYYEGYIQALEWVLEE